MSYILKNENHRPTASITQRIRHSRPHTRRKRHSRKRKGFQFKVPALMLPRFMNYSIFIYILFMLWASPSEPSFLLRKSQERRITTTDVIDLTFWLGFISLVRGLPEGCVIVIFSILPCPMHQEKGLADLGGLLLCPVCTYFLSERAKVYFGAKPWLCSALFDWWSILASPYLEEFL